MEPQMQSQPQPQLQPQPTINQLIHNYKCVLDDKNMMEIKLKEMERNYIKLLIKSSKFNETLCDNCWEIVMLRKNKNPHVTQLIGSNPSYLCRKTSIDRVLKNLINN